MLYDLCDAMNIKGYLYSVAWSKKTEKKYLGTGIICFYKKELENVKFYTTPVKYNDRIIQMEANGYKILNVY